MKKNSPSWMTWSVTSKHRKQDRPLDIIIMGVTSDAESGEAVKPVEQRAASGATWWLESVTPFRAGKSYEYE